VEPLTKLLRDIGYAELIEPATAASAQW